MMKKNSESNRTEARMLRDLHDLHDAREEELIKLRDEYKKCPPGKLYMRNKNGRCSFYEHIDNRDRAINREQDRIQSLARKRLIEHEIDCREIFCGAAEEAIKKIENGFKRCGNKQSGIALDRIYASEYLSNIEIDEDAARWKNEEYVTNPYRVERAKYVSKSGIKVRSKSEKIIADKLWEENIDFRYEAQWYIDDAAYYPDFTIRKGSGRIVLWEHFGLTDDPKYFDNMAVKLEKYRQCGFKQHTNLICTYEEDIETTDTLDAIIDKYLL